MNEKSWELYSQILAQENVHLEYSQYARTAYFDLDKRVVTIPMFEYMNDEVTQLLISHEVGHACHSTYTMDEYRQYTSKYKDLFNVVEDAHVENKLKTEFNGLKSIFFNGYKTLYKNNFFEINEKTISKLSLTERLNLFYKIGHIVNVSFNNDESEFAVRMKFVSSKEDVISLCEDILAYLHQNNSSDEEKQKNKFSSKCEEGSKHPSYGDESNTESKSDVSNEYDESSSTNEKADVEDGEEDVKSKNEEKRINKELTDRISSRFNKKLKEFGEKQISNSNVISQVSLNLSTRCAYNNLLYYPNYYKMVKKHKFLQTRLCKELIRQVKSLAKSADVVFQQKKKAEELKKTRNVRLGKLNLKKLPYYKINENLFSSVKISSDGENHGIVILVDYSGSMISYLRDTLLQACILGEFCRMNDIPFVIIAFGVMYTKFSNFHKRKINRVAVLGNNDNFDIGCILDLSDSESIFTNEDTPTVDALLAASYFIEQFKLCGVEKTSLFLITDGRYTNDIILDDKITSFSRNSSCVTIDNVLYSIESVIPKNKREHRNWIIELLFLNLKRRFGTFISVSFIGCYDAIKDSVSINVAKKIFGEKKLSNSNNNFYYYGDENYIYLWKHSYYFEDCKKIPKELKNGIISYNFLKNPFLNQFQFFDYSIKEETNNLFMDRSLYFKKLKIFVNGFIEEFS